MKREDFERFAITMVGHAALQSNPASTVGLSGLSLLRALSERRAMEKARDAFDALVNEIAAAEDFASTDEKQKRVEQALRDADDATIDTVLEGFRGMLAALDPSALPYAARLTARYFSKRRSRDVFFRRIGALLVEASASTVEELEGLAGSLRRVLGNPIGFRHLTTCVVVIDHYMPGYFEPPPTRIDLLVSAEENLDTQHECTGVSIATARMLERTQVATVVTTDENTRVVFQLAAPEMLNDFVDLFCG